MHLTHNIQITRNIQINNLPTDILLEIFKWRIRNIVYLRATNRYFGTIISKYTKSIYAKSIKFHGYKILALFQKININMNDFLTFDKRYNFFDKNIHARTSQLKLDILRDDNLYALLLIMQISPFNESENKFIVDYLAEHNSFCIMKYYLSYNSITTAEYIYYAIRIAIQNYSVKVFEMILNDSRFNLHFEEFVDTNELLEHCILEVGDIEMLKILHAAKIFELDISDVFSIICKFVSDNANALAMFSYYSNVPHMYPVINNKWYLTIAVLRSDIKQVQFILQLNNTFSADDLSELHNILYISFNENDNIRTKTPKNIPLIIEILLLDSRFSQGGITDDSFRNICENGWINIVKLLIESKRICIYHYSLNNPNCIFEVVVDGYIDIIKLFLSFPFVDPTAHYNQAYNWAVTHKPDIAELLFKDPRVFAAIVDNGNFIKEC